MLPTDQSMAAVRNVSRRLISERVRELFVRLCGEIGRFSPEIELEVAAFEIRMFGTGGFRVVVSPYRDLFVTAIGPPGACDIRVSSEEGFIRALDLSLEHFLETRRPVTVKAADFTPQRPPK
jgi:hypothetical protein